MGQKYTELSPTQTKKIFKIIDKYDGDHGFHADHAKIMAQDLTFAPSWQRIICEDYSSVPFQSKTYLMKDDKIKTVKYTANPWVDNDFSKMNLDLNTLNIEAYLKFYFDFFVTGSDHLKPVSFSDEIDWQGDLTPTMKQSLDKDFVLYPQINQKETMFTIKMPCVFRQSIMIVTFHVADDGQIEIKDRQSLVDDLPIRHFA